MSSFTQAWNHHKQLSIFRDSFDCNKVTISCLKCSTMDTWLKLNFQKRHEIEIWTFLTCIQCIKMSYFTQTWNRHKQIIVFRDIFVSNNVTLSYLKCSTMNPLLKLKFPKHHEIEIWTFQIVFSASTCRPSPRLGFIIWKLVSFEISLIVKK